MWALFLQNTHCEGTSLQNSVLVHDAYHTIVKQHRFPYINKNAAVFLPPETGVGGSVTGLFYTICGPTEKINDMDQIK